MGLGEARRAAWQSAGPRPFHPDQTKRCAAFRCNMLDGSGLPALAIGGAEPGPGRCLDSHAAAADPKRLMLGYLLGALMTSITLGLVIVFALKGSSPGSTTEKP